MSLSTSFVHGLFRETEIEQIVFVSAHKREKSMGITPEGSQRGRIQMTRKFQDNDRHVSNPYLGSICSDTIGMNVCSLFGKLWLTYEIILMASASAPTAMMFSKPLQLLATLLATVSGYFIHIFDEACFLDDRYL